MPVRDRAIEALTRHLEDSVSFNNVEHTVRLGPASMPVTVDRDFYEKRYGGAYEAIVEAIDWNRVLLEAQARHLKLEHYPSIPPYDDLEDFVCGECIAAALLATETFPEYT